MRTRDSFSEAVAAIWRALESEVRAGDPLPVQDLAAASGLSATPLREAMAWLCGQGLVERRPGRGYFAPAATATGVAQTYGLHRRYLLWALDQWPGKGGEAAPVPPPGGGALALFEAVAAGSRDAALVAAHRRALLRLRQLQWAEPAPDPSEAVRLRAAEQGLLKGASEPVRAFAEAYHHDRIAAAGEIAARLRGAPSNIIAI